MQLETIFTGRLVRLAAPHPDDHETFARWSENDQYLQITDNDPARPVSAEAHHSSNRRPVSSFGSAPWQMTR